MGNCVLSWNTLLADVANSNISVYNSVKHFTYSQILQLLSKSIAFLAPLGVFRGKTVYAGQELTLTLQAFRGTLPLSIKQSAQFCCCINNEKQHSSHQISTLGNSGAWHFWLLKLNMAEWKKTNTPFNLGGKSLHQPLLQTHWGSWLPNFRFILRCFSVA